MYYKCVFIVADLRKTQNIFLFPYTKEQEHFWKKNCTPQWDVGYILCHELIFLEDKPLLGTDEVRYEFHVHKVMFDQ
jgi:hypothetical protein